MAGDGVAFLDGDGRLDVAVVNDSTIEQYLGGKSNRLAIGARVSVPTAALTQIDEVRAGSSYNSSNDTRLHFGLGPDSVIRALEVRWPSGAKQRFEAGAGDAIYELAEGGTLRRGAALPPVKP